MESLEQVKAKLEERSFFLRERIKEQRCLLRISMLSTRTDLPLRTLFEELVAAIVPAWQYPEITIVRITYRSLQVASESFADTPLLLTREIVIREEKVGKIEVGYLEKLSFGASSPFLEEEEHLLEAIGELVESIIEKKNDERIIQRTSKKLRLRTQELVRKNLALKEILGQIERDKREIMERISIELRKSVMPLIHNLRNGDIPRETLLRYLDTIDDRLLHIDAALSESKGLKNARLSPRELEICNMIKSGFQTKEISKILKLSVLTVERHRFNIRKKLDLHNVHVNLQTYLRES